MTDVISLSIPTSFPNDTGRLASHNNEAQKYRDAIIEAAGIAGVPPCVIVGIGSRESGWGMLLSPPGPSGTGDGGHGRGLMQVDDRWHKQFIESGQWRDARANIIYGAHVLHDSIAFMRTYTKLAGINLLGAGVAGYNCGAGNAHKAILEGANIDRYTSGRDYSRDVLSRAGWFQQKGWA